MQGPFYVFYHHCYELVNLEGPFALEEEALKVVEQTMMCGCDNPTVKVIQGIEVDIVPVEVVTKFTLQSKKVT